MIRYFLTLIAGCCLSLSVLAVEQADFYSASVPVPDREPASFKKGGREALLQVLVKVSAEPAEKVRGVPELAADLERGSQLATQFSYVARKELSGTGQLQERLYLKASFPEATIHELLQKGGLRFWQNNRPQVLIWPVLRSSNSVKIAKITTGQEGSLIQMMSDSAQQYGLPWVMGEAGNQVNADTLWVWDEAAIKKVSQPYQKTIILVSRLAITSDGQGMGGWLLIDGDSREQIDISTGSVSEFVRRGMAWAAARLASRYAVTLSTMDNELVLAIDGIDSERKYLGLMDYLDKLDVIDNVYLLSAHGSVLRVAVTLKADVSQLQNVLALEKMLLAQPAGETGTTEMSFSWNGL